MFSQDVEEPYRILEYWNRIDNYSAMIAVYDNTTHCVVDVKKQSSRGIL